MGASGKTGINPGQRCKACCTIRQKIEIVGLSFQPTALVKVRLMKLIHNRTPKFTARAHTAGSADLARLGLEASSTSSLEMSCISSSFLEECEEANPTSTPMSMRHWQPKTEVCFRKWRPSCLLHFSICCRSTFPILRSESAAYSAAQRAPCGCK